MARWMWSEDGQRILNVSHVVSFGVSPDGSRPLVATMVSGETEVPVYERLNDDDPEADAVLVALADRLGAIHAGDVAADLEAELKNAVPPAGNLRVGDAGYEVPKVHVMEPPRGRRRGGEGRDENRGE